MVLYIDALLRACRSHRQRPKVQRRAQNGNTIRAARARWQHTCAADIHEQISVIGAVQGARLNAHLRGARRKGHAYLATVSGRQRGRAVGKPGETRGGREIDRIQVDERLVPLVRNGDNLRRARRVDCHIAKVQGRRRRHKEVDVRALSAQRNNLRTVQAIRSNRQRAGDRGVVGRRK